MKKIAQIIIKIVDFIYQPFENFLPKQVFRYACCGGGNMIFDWVLYFFVYNFVIGHNLIYIGSFCISPHIAALCVVFPITLLTGFWLNKYVTFTQSSLLLRSQLLRYILIVAINLLINYFGLKLLVDMFHWYPTPSKIFITLITVVISYIGQKYYSFKD